jgi:chemotaxis protein MotB
MSKDKKIIVVRRVKKGHGGHHGGSWKVAYADFVTAMMAFFMVMWILGLDEGVKSAIENYFSNPTGNMIVTNGAVGVSPLPVGASTPSGEMKPFMLVSRAAEERRFQEIGDRIEAKLGSSDGLDSIAAQVEVVMTQEGLRIELVEGEGGDLFFELGSAVLKPAAGKALAVIAAELRGATAPIVVEGHTDSSPSRRGWYTNFELSADRANAARRAMEGAGLSRSRMEEIRGHADRQLRDRENPLNPANRRISILLPFTTPPAEVAVPAGSAPAVNG